MMRDYFSQVADFIQSQAAAGEVLVSRLAAEDSDFIRFNKSAVRQVTGVRQVLWTLGVIRDGRRSDARVTLTGNLAPDCETLRDLLAELRAGIDQVPADPYLLYETALTSTSRESTGSLPPAGLVIDDVLAAAKGLDLVGFFAGGPIVNAFANSLGQRNWHAVENFSFGWSLYHDRDKAVKTTYAGSSWDSAAFSRKMDFARAQLARLGEAPKSLAPGQYRAFLSPAAMEEILGMLCWGGFGLKSRRTKQSPLIRMADQGARLNAALTLAELTAEGIAPGFQSEGFVRPARVPLIESGELASALVSPRSAREYGVATNGANGAESPESLDLAAGNLPQESALQALDTGIYLGNLWYLNFSDRSACRMTGMTRFASFWVEGGEIKAPLNVMRFDDTVYRILGENLEALTAERDLLVDSSSYGSRSTGSLRTPGALVRDFSLTL
jgi:predicted Zn-dependent protease